MMTSPIGPLPRILLAVCLGLSSLAATPPYEGSRFAPQPRSIFLSEAPQQEVPQLFVAADMVTTLRIDGECDPEHTQLLGWEGRFAPLLVGGGLVVIQPNRQLSPEDRFLLRVALKDGTSLPFSVVSHDGDVDAQVNVFRAPESAQSMRAMLEEEQAENASLRSENQRRKEEGNSVDHALAALLINDEVEMTPFKEIDKWVMRQDGLDVEMRIFTPRKQGKSGARNKAGVVFRLMAKDPKKLWEFQEARLSTSNWQPRSFALREVSSPTAMGQVGRFAFIIDLNSLDLARDGDKLFLGLFSRGGKREVYTELIPSRLMQ